MNKHKRLEILTRLRDANPYPTTELNYSSPFELLIAVILSAQSTDVGVNKATNKLYPIANTPTAIFALGVNGLKHYIKTIGLFNAKAENVIKTCGMLINQHDSVIPQNREALEALPGVGRKTANVVLNTAFGWPTIAVDTHIFRVSNRTKLAMGKNVDLVEQKLIKVVPNEFKVDVHHWLILHGRYTCIARKPRCGSCLIEDLCEFKDKKEEEITMEGTKRINIKTGTKVSIVRKQDQRTGTVTAGSVEKILTNSPIHTHGIKVRLDSGEVGRVKQIHK